MVQSVRVWSPVPISHDNHRGYAPGTSRNCIMAQHSWPKQGRKASFKASSACLRFCCSSRMALTSSWCTFKVGQEVFQHTLPPQSSGTLWSIFLGQNYEWQEISPFCNLLTILYFEVPLLAKIHLQACSASPGENWAICLVIAQVSNCHAVFPKQHGTVLVFLVFHVCITFTIGQL